MIHALGLALTLAAVAPADALVIETRGEQLCVEQNCYVRLPLGTSGLDVRGQMDRFHTLFNDNLEPKTTRWKDITFRQLIDVAGALALGPAARADFENSFRQLKVTYLGVQLSPPPAAPDQKPAEGISPIEIGYVASLVWTDATGTTGVATVRGHLAVARDFVVDAGRPPEDLNALLSPLINVDVLDGGGPTAAQIKGFIGPAILGNFILAMLAPTDELKGSELENVGRALQDEVTTAPSAR